MSEKYDDVLQRLREERERTNLTQQLLCCHMQIQQSHFSRAETGQRRFSYHELEGLCTTDVDILYMFTGKRPTSGRDFLKPSELTPAELICFLNTVYILICTLKPAGHSKTPLGTLHQQLEYIQFGAGNARGQNNVFLSVRTRRGYTQEKMADRLGVDIKKLRALEKGRLLPDSEIIWKMYDLFRVSPVFILKNTRGLLNELNYVLDQMEDGDREIMMRILENEHRLMCGEVDPV